MQYLIHDLLKLPLEDRLAVVERLICSIRQDQQDTAVPLQIPAAHPFTR